VIGLCTDSNSQLPTELARRFGIEVVPLTVVVDGTEYHEGVDLDADRFYDFFAGGRIPEVSTSQPSPGEFLVAYRRLADRGCTEILSVHLTAGVSGTVGAATIAAAGAPVPVRVVDSGTASFGVSCCVWAAALAVRAGATMEEAAGAAEALRATIATAFIVGVPQLTEAGGRAADLELREGIPVLAMEAGALVVVDRVASVGAAVVSMARYALARHDRVNIAIGTSDASSRPVADALADALVESDQVAEIVRYRIGPSVGAHTGPGTAGLFAFPAT
jgi:DegV family protein with EDD domain